MPLSSNRLYLLTIAAATVLAFVSVSIANFVVTTSSSFSFSSSSSSSFSSSPRSAEFLAREIQQLKERLKQLKNRQQQKEEEEEQQKQQQDGHPPEFHPKSIQNRNTNEDDAPPISNMTMSEQPNSIQNGVSTISLEAGSKEATFESTIVTGQARSKYAYAFVVGGVRYDRLCKFRGYIYNILVSAQLLKEFGSTADVVAMIQMSSRSSETMLQEVDWEPLRIMGIRVKYLPKDMVDSFYGTVMHKFDILDLVEYRRVILMDGDVMPMGNLDYLFHLSDGDLPGHEAILKPNFVLSGPMEPSNAGFFMLEPGPGRLEEVQQIMRRREVSSPEQGFDRYMGWGHPISPPDYWEARTKKGTNWTFLFAESDQGLLYYYTKYYVKNVSLIQEDDRVENWGQDANGNPIRENVMRKTFAKYSRPYVRNLGACAKFRCDFMHFTSRTKPWLRMPAPTNESNKFVGPHTLWWHTMKTVNVVADMQLNFSNWTKLSGNPLGYFAGKRQTFLNFKNKSASKERQFKHHQTLPNTRLQPLKKQHQSS